MRPLLRGLVALAVGGAALLLVPAAAPADPAPGAGAVTVRAAGDRDPATGVPLPLAGAVLRAFADPTLTAPVGECTTDATGSCTISGLADGTYWVAPVAAPDDGTFARVGEVDPSVGGPQPYA